MHTDYRNPVEKKGWHGHSLSEREWEGRSQPDPCLDRLVLLFWAHYIRMVLIYYAQVHCRWLPFTDNKGKNAANYFKKKDVTAQGGKWLNWLHSILGRFSTDFRKLRYSVNICCLNPGWGSFSKSKSHSSLRTMQAWVPPGEPISGHGSCVLDLAPHWLLWVGARLHFPCMEWFPIHKWDSVAFVLM